MDFEIKRLKADNTIGNFDCGNEDINHFLVEDSLDYLEKTNKGA